MFIIISTFSLYAQQILILGVTQDGGYPHIGCSKTCCEKVHRNPKLKNFVVSLALMDTTEKKWWLFDATPDITAQLELFRQETSSKYNYLPDGIFITHAHIGHYPGLMYLGREAMNAKEVPVYTLPRLCRFLKDNGPWSQLVSINNIILKEVKADSTLKLNQTISIITFIVPHRDEYSETAGFKIIAGKKKILFIPDIDKWSKWNKNIIEEVKDADIALLDGTFNDSTELPSRNISEIPHPFISETVDLFKNESSDLKKKIYFIHFNHTNPVLWNEEKRMEIIGKGFNIPVLKLIL